MACLTNRRADSHRYSLASNSDSPHTATFETSTAESAILSAPQRPRYDSNALLMLPAPLAASQQNVRGNMTSSSSTIGVSRGSEEAYNSESFSASRTKLIPTSPTGEQYSDSHDSATTLTPTTSRTPILLDSPRVSIPNLANVRDPPSPSYYPANAQRQYRLSTSSPTVYDDRMAFPSSGELEDAPTRGAARGVRLTDSGPVPGTEGVRRVSRPSGRRPTSQVAPQNRYSRSDTMHTLPPGAAPPQPVFFPPPNI
jgi:chitin synthase